MSSPTYDEAEVGWQDYVLLLCTFGSASLEALHAFWTMGIFLNHGTGWDYLVHSPLPIAVISFAASLRYAKHDRKRDYISAASTLGVLCMTLHVLWWVVLKGYFYRGWKIKNWTALFAFGLHLWHVYSESSTPRMIAIIISLAINAPFWPLLGSGKWKIWLLIHSGSLALLCKWYKWDKLNRAGKKDGSDIESENEDEKEPTNPDTPKTPNAEKRNPETEHNPEPSSSRPTNPRTSSNHPPRPHSASGPLHQSAPSPHATTSAPSNPSPPRSSESSQSSTDYSPSRPLSTAELNLLVEMDRGAYLLAQKISRAPGNRESYEDEINSLAKEFFSKIVEEKVRRMTEEAAETDERKEAADLSGGDDDNGEEELHGEEAATGQAGQKKRKRSKKKKGSK